MQPASMVRTITANNPNDGLEDALWWLKTSGVINDSRNGRVLQSTGPVITTYTKPTQRVMFSPLRDANPFFHLFEGIWMLAGKNDSASVAQYAKQMTAFSDDSTTLWGAYGWRWRDFFGFDQLKEIVTLLRADPKTRRAVLTMWSPVGDLIAKDGRGGITGKDVPCNTQVYFDLTRGRLDMTVCNRSNDIVWGCYGANMVHMSMLQEFVASALGAPVGLYHQFSNNFHMYVDREDCARLMDARGSKPDNWFVKYSAEDLYSQRELRLMPMFEPGDLWEDWLHDAERFAEFPSAEHYGRSRFFGDVAGPLMTAHAEYKYGGDIREALKIAQRCLAEDWRIAATDWLTRRWKKQEESARAE